MPRRLVVSTAGIGILLNSLGPEERPQWHSRLMKLSNTKDFSSDQEASAKVQELKERAFTRLVDGDVAARRRLSPELNGLYGLYDNHLNSGSDIHCLISTDTAFGNHSAQILQQFLDSHGLNTNIVVPEGLNTATVADFSKGMKNLLSWCEQTLPGYRQSGYEVIFNLTAAFKSLQGYLNIMGMFYADRLLYIFEGSTEILTIPPIANPRGH